jgi:hypothetical protein
MYVLFDKDADFVNLIKAFYGSTPLAFAMQPSAKFVHPVFMRPFNVLRFSAPNRPASAKGQTTLESLTHRLPITEKEGIHGRAYVQKPFV